MTVKTVLIAECLFETHIYLELDDGTLQKTPFEKITDAEFLGKIFEVPVKQYFLD